MDRNLTESKEFYSPCHEHMEIIIYGTSYRVKNKAFLFSYKNGTIKSYTEMKTSAHTL